MLTSHQTRIVLAVEPREDARKGWFMSPRKAGFVAVVFIWSVGLSCAARAQQPRAGEYVREFGQGELFIARASKRALTFKLDAHGPNAHFCTLEGEILQGVAMLDDAGSNALCKVQFEAVRAGIRVRIEENPETCFRLCGVRGGFEGDYLKPALGCTPTELRATRSAFKRAYDMKVYVKARSLLEPVLAKCTKTLRYLDEGWIRNDVAIAQYRSGDLKACRRTLAEFGSDIEETEEQVYGRFQPNDAENWWPVVSAARTNKKLCDARDSSKPDSR